MTPNRPPAAAPAGSAQSRGASGHGAGTFLYLRPDARLSFPPCRPARPFQRSGPCAEGLPPAAAAANPPTPEWRRTGNYRFPALADSVRRLQYTTLAMQLREYCADRRVSDDFVRERLQRFGRITGRAETCASLRDY